jgi:hypothetical protein
MARDTNLKRDDEHPQLTLIRVAAQHARATATEANTVSARMRPPKIPEALQQQSFAALEAALRLSARTLAGL